MKKQKKAFLNVEKFIVARLENLSNVYGGSNNEQSDNEQQNHSTFACNTHGTDNDTGQV